MSVDPVVVTGALINFRSRSRLVVARRNYAR
jgi:hypothetical protein